MNQKRVLLLHEDLLLTNLYREKLEAAGFAVETGRTGEAGLKGLAERSPDAIVLDPVLPTSDIVDLITALRASKGGKPTPVIVLPTARQALSETVQEAGADVVLARGVNQARPGEDLHFRPEPRNPSGR